MKHKLRKRLFAAGMALVMAVGLLGTSALADTFKQATEIEPVGGTGNDGRIVVTVYDNNPGTAGTGAATTVTDAKPVDGVGINALRIGSVVELTSTADNKTVTTQVAFGLTETYATLLGLDTGNAIANQDTTYYFAPTVVQTALTTANANTSTDTGAVTQATIEAYLNDTNNGATKIVTGALDGDEDKGVATFSNLTYGLYLLAKSELPSDATTDLVPFLVSVPMYVESDTVDAWQSTVYAYPKVRTGDIEVTKTVNDGDKYVNAGQTLTYTVTTTIPKAETGNGSATPFTSLKITDDNTDSTLDIAESTVEVKLDGTPMDEPVYSSSEPATLTSGDYEVEYAGGVLTITLTADGLSKINDDMTNAQTITVTYDATVATDVDFDTKLTNTAKATYQRAGMTTTAETNTAKVDLYTYGLDLTKTLSDNAAITENKISFELYKDNEGKLGEKIPVTSATGGNSGYWVAASEQEPSVVMYVGTDKKLNLYGLEPGTYYLKETATMPGYTLLAEPITIVITASAQQTGDPTVTATVNTAEAQVSNGLVSLSVENTKNQGGFNLPQTGGAGTLLATAIGLGLLCVAVILLAVNRKKEKH